MLKQDMLRNEKQITEKLLQQFHSFFSREENYSRQGHIWRIQTALGTIDLLNWLQQQNFEIKTYWSGRDHRFAMAGVGSVHDVSGDFPIAFPALFAQMQNVLTASHPELRFYGGIRFDSSQPPSAEWQQFSTFRFIIPKFEIFHDGVQSWFACNFTVPSKENSQRFLKELQSEIERLKFKWASSQELPDCKSRRDFPDWQEWKNNVVRALDLFKDQGLQKIVLARKSVLQFSQAIDPVSLFKILSTTSPHSFHFCFQRNSRSAFLGITPERLYRRDNSDVFSEAVAGTRLRGSDERMDRILGDELLQSEKDLREHRWVSDMVKSSIEPFCDSISILAKEQLLKLPNVQHLHTLFNGHLSNGVSDGEILARLHPTPAVGGFPRDESMSYIAEMEPFDRGWYAGPVGWVSNKASEFAVAIRSALVFGNSLSLFAGSGIVQGSNPKKEWEENENKILNFTKLFKTDDASC